MGVKGGLKDVGRVLCIDFQIMNELTKKIEEWSDRPDLKFHHLDELKDSTREDERQAWEEFNAYEQRFPKLFASARRFEGVVRNLGKHASGILITPFPVDDLFPTRTDEDGTIITLYTGTQLEDLKALKFDILGLKTLTVIKKTLASINEELTFEDLYDAVNVNDPEMFEMIRNKETEGLFQIESNLFKGMIEDIQPDSLNDIIVINALGRPGPIKAGMPAAYAKRKRGEEEAIEPLPNTWDIVEDTLGTIVYQEQLMLIAKRVALYDDNQTDSYLRKAIAKKKRDKMDQCKQWFIYGKLNEEAPEGYDSENKAQPMYDPKGKYGPAILGGINNGYDALELEEFWIKMEGYADYLFNKSHSSTYGYVAVLTAYLKKYHLPKFYAALLSMQDKAEKVDLYIKSARKLGVDVKAPDINLSSEDFDEINGDILFGLKTIKGIGVPSIPGILESRPYASIADAMEKMGSKFNKKIGTALIKAGGFDFYNTNRFEVFNEFLTIRAQNKCKDTDDYYNADEYNDMACISFEQNFLGSAVTYLPWWDSVPVAEKVEVDMELIEVIEKIDKKGNMMGFIKGISQGCEIKALAFSKLYCSNVDAFDMNRITHVVMSGTKDDKGTFLIKKVLSSRFEVKQKTIQNTNDIDDRLETML